MLSIPMLPPGPPWSVSRPQGRALWGEDLTGRGLQGSRKDSELVTAPPHPTPAPLHALAGSLEERAAVLLKEPGLQDEGDTCIPTADSC